MSDVDLQFGFLPQPGIATPIFNDDGDTHFWIVSLPIRSEDFARFSGVVSDLIEDRFVSEIKVLPNVPESQYWTHRFDTEPMVFAKDPTTGALTPATGK